MDPLVLQTVPASFATIYEPLRKSLHKSLSTRMRVCYCAPRRARGCWHSDLRDSLRCWRSVSCLVLDGVVHSLPQDEALNDIREAVHDFESRAQELGRQLGATALVRQIVPCPEWKQSDAHCLHSIASSVEWDW